MRIKLSDNDKEKYEVTYWVYTRNPSDRVLYYWSLEHSYDTYDKAAKRANELQCAFDVKIQEQLTRTVFKENRR